MGNISPEQFRELARIGAAARVQELLQEEAAIRALFPDLFGGRHQARDVGEDGAAPGPARRRRPRMSAAARKAVSERMRRYWAERRRAKAVAS